MRPWTRRSNGGSLRESGRPRPHIFLRDAEARWATLLWATVQEPVMRIHYSLFKRGTWVTERPKQEGDAAAAAATHFADAANSPAVKACASLASLLDNAAEDAQWKGIVGQYGPLETWPQHRLRATRRRLLVGVGQLFRKLLEPMSRYPWRLAALTQEEGAGDVASAFWSAAECCLDGDSSCPTRAPCSKQIRGCSWLRSLTALCRPQPLPSESLPG